MNSKERYFDQPYIDVAGDSTDPRTHIYRLLYTGLMVRYAEFDSGKGGESVEILHLTDPHLNYYNNTDVVECNPVVESSRKYRSAFRDRITVANFENCMRIAPLFDQVVISGDTMDYLTWGSLELMEELIWSKYPDTLVALGGHDITRKMQGLIEDKTSIESRYEILQQNWKHDVFYTSRVLKNKVIVIQMDNGQHKYVRGQYEKLKADIELAKRENFIILIFQHDPLCTGNPKDEQNYPIRVNDPGNIDFYNRYVGCQGSDEETMKVYNLIVENADVIKGVFCGHRHSDHYMEIKASYLAEGKRVETIIPQYVQAGTMYDEGHILTISVK